MEPYRCIVKGIGKFCSFPVKFEFRVWAYDLEDAFHKAWYPPHIDVKEIIEVTKCE